MEDETVVHMSTSSANNGGAPDPDAIKMFVGQIPRSWGETELRKLFEEFGSVYQLSVLRDKATGESRGCCFVTFYHRRDAIASQGALHNIKILPGMHHPIQMKPADTENRNERKLFVGMVSKKINEPDVKTMFASFGLIEDCTVLRDAAGNSKGCAFVTFSSRASALNAIKAMHQSRTMEGCSMPLVVKFADTQKDKDQKKQPAGNGAQPLIPTVSAPGLIPFAAANSATTYPTLRHSSILPAAGSPVFGLLQNLQGLNAAVAGNPGLAQAAGLPLLANHNTSGLAASAAASLGSLGYGLSSQLAANTAPTTGMAALINYLLTAAAVSPASGWKPPTIPSTSPSSLNGSFLQLASAAGGSPYLPQAYTTGDTIPLAAAAAHSTLGTAVTGSLNSTKQLEGPEGANLFIYHLPQEFTDSDLAQTFAPFGTLLSAKVFVDKQTNLSKCFGFVSFQNPTSAHTAIQAMNGFQIGTKRLKVQLKRSKQDSKPYLHPQHSADGAKV